MLAWGGELASLETYKTYKKSTASTRSLCSHFTITYNLVEPYEIITWKPIIFLCVVWLD